MESKTIPPEGNIVLEPGDRVHGELKLSPVGWFSTLMFGLSLVKVYANISIVVDRGQGSQGAQLVVTKSDSLGVRLKKEKHARADVS